MSAGSPYKFVCYLLFKHLRQMQSTDVSIRSHDPLRELEMLKLYTLINQSWEHTLEGGCITLLTLWRYSWWSRLLNLHTGYLPVTSNSQQEASTCHSHQLCGDPLGLLHAGLSLSETIR